MLDCLKKVDGKKLGVFAAGVAFGTAGIKVLSSKDAKKLYTNCTAAVLRAKECVLKTATKVQEIFMQRHSRSMRTVRKQKRFLVRKRM